MNQKQFETTVEKLNEYDGIDEIYLLNYKGEILFKSKESVEFNEEESKVLLKAWKEKEPSIHFMNERYAILKNDEIQLAAKNFSGNGNIAGSVTKDGDYLLIHIREDTGLILLEWSIFVNKVAWDQ
ncbi:MAG: hypothetical protein GF329_10475 [Candidatus Lokiarchaeota archaeon]|nr:hypothetical protein [Candidatus Lokiarchaeota archaeon]